MESAQHISYEPLHEGEKALASSPTNEQGAHMDVVESKVQTNHQHFQELMVSISLLCFATKHVQITFHDQYRFMTIS